MDNDTQTTDPNPGEPQIPDDKPQDPGIPPVFSEEASSVGSSGGLTQEPFPTAEGSPEPASAPDGTSDAPDAPGPAHADEGTPTEQV